MLAALVVIAVPPRGARGWWYWWFGTVGWAQRLLWVALGGDPAGTGWLGSWGAPGPTSCPTDGLLWVLSPQGAGRVLREWKHLQGAAEALLHQKPAIEWVLHACSLSTCREKPNPARAQGLCSVPAGREAAAICLWLLPHVSPARGCCLLAFLLGVGQLGLGGRGCRGRRGCCLPLLLAGDKHSTGTSWDKVAGSRMGIRSCRGGQGANVHVTELAMLPVTAGRSAAVGTAEAGWEWPAPTSAVWISLRLTNGVFIFFFWDVISCLERVRLLILNSHFLFLPTSCRLVKKLKHSTTGCPRGSF